MKFHHVSIIFFTFSAKFAFSIDTAIELDQGDNNIEEDPGFELVSWDSIYSELTPQSELLKTRKRRSSTSSKNRYFCETENGYFLGQFSNMGIIPIVVSESSNTAGEMVYLGLSGKNLNHDKFRFAPTRCVFQRYNGDEEPGCLTEYPIFDSNSTATCGNRFVSLGLDYKNRTWRIQHRLFVIGNKAFKENGDSCDDKYRLICNVKLCTNEEIDSECDNVAKNCLEDKKEFLCNGRCAENETCDLDENDGTVCTPN